MRFGIKLPPPVQSFLCIQASRNVRGCLERTRKHVDAIKEERSAEKDGHHVEDSLLSKMEGSKGIRRSSESVVSKRLQIL